MIYDTREYEFRPADHDGGSKTFLGQTGAWDGPDIIDIVLGPAATVAVGPNAGIPSRVVAARFLSRKLWEAFAAGGPPTAVVNALGDVLVANDFEIKAWVKAMLMRPEFQGTAVRQGLLKTPTEYIVELMYHSNLRAAVCHPEWYAADMGQALFFPPNVSGWKVNGYWINAAAIAARAAFAESIRWIHIDRRNAGQPLTMRNGSWSWATLDSKSPSQLIDLLADALDLELSTRTRNALVNWATAEATPSGPSWWRSTNALMLSMVCPEMSVA
jgi:uncharacterized protein (DUF1800 family)